MEPAPVLSESSSLTILTVERPDATRSQIKILHTYCQGAAATALVLALMNLSGWAFHIAWLTSFSPGHVTIKVNTAVCLALASTSLMLQIPGYSAGSRGKVAQAIAILVLLIAAATLTEYIFNANLGIDQLWMNDTMASYGTSSPGRPAPLTAMGLIAVGLALLLLGSKKQFALLLAQMLSLICALVSLIAFDGYLYHAGIPYKLFHYTLVAVPTAVGLLLLSSAIFFVRPRNGIAKDLIGDGPGSFIARRFLPAVFIAPILFDWISLYGQKARMYGPAFTPALNATLNTITFAVVIWSSARQVDREHDRRSEAENLRSLFQGVKDYAIMSLDPEGRVTSWNEGAQRIEGYSAAEVFGHHFSQFYTPEAVAAGRPGEELQIATERGRFEEEGVRVRKDGSRFWANVIITALHDDAGQLRGFAKVTRDIGAHKKAESEKLRLTERLSLATSISKVGVWEWDVANDGVVWDGTMFEIYGIPATVEITRKKWAAMIHSDDLAAVDADLRKAIATRSQGAVEFRIARPDGSVRFVSAVEKVYLDDDANVIRVIGVNVDATERRLAEATREQLLQAQKLESIGQLAAGIAHEINTPVQYIGDNVRFLQDGFGQLAVLNDGYARLLDGVRSTGATPRMLEEITLVIETIDVDYLFGEIPKAIEQTLEGVSRVAALVSAMKEFSHPGTGEKVPLNLNHAIEGTITVARNEWKYVADLKMELDPTLPLVSCFPGEFNQVVLNMIVNAAHAIEDVAAKGGPEKGLITIRTRSIPGGVEVQIQDTGGGIPEKVRPRIFDPFFTTKEIGKGTGQGLAIARSVVVDKHQGTIDFETVDGYGTTFIIRLPCEAVPSPDLAAA